ncbi:MAG: glycosyltransferase family 2 protein [Treponema sp.]
MGITPLISLSVPVYGTESSLPALLDSVLEQGFLSDSAAGQGALPLEIIVVNDGSPSGFSLPKILKPYKKKFKTLGIPLTLLEHSKNLGLVEARRTAVEAASGTCLCFADSDDTLPPNALQSLYDAALSSGADIVHGKAEYKAAFSEEEAALYKKDSLAEMEEKIKKVCLGRLEKDELLNSFLIKGELSSFLWGKLFRTETVKAAFADIPRTFCTMGEDFLIYFFILLHARSYFGIEDTVYTYHIGTGISSSREIKDLSRWERACTAASVFAIVFSYLEEHPFSSPNKNELMAALQNRCKNNMLSNLRHLKRVIPSLRDEAYKILCDYWGEEYVKAD